MNPMKHRRDNRGRKMEHVRQHLADWMETRNWTPSPPPRDRQRERTQRRKLWRARWRRFVARKADSGEKRPGKLERRLMRTRSR